MKRHRDDVVNDEDGEERKRRATRDINGNDPSDTAGDEETTGEGSIAKVLVAPSEVGTDAVVLPSKTSDKFPFL
jgi:hypothetical protein